jgi:predicted phage terminase large subunit-like protein
LNQLTIQNNVPAKVRPILESDKRWLILKGGRASAKSWSAADIFISRTMADGKDRLCTREIQKSIKDSSLKLISKKIKEKKLERYFDIQKTTIKCINGGEFIFQGMNDLQSMEGVQDVWIEEGQSASKDRVLELTPTIRAPGSQILVTYNPKFEDSYIHQIATGDEYADVRTVVELNWRDNPWFPEVLNQERLLMKSINIDLYNWIWEGQTLKHIKGKIIKAEYFGRYEKLPTLVKSIIIADTANKIKEQHDYTVFLFGGLGIDGNIYLMDLFRDKLEAPELLPAALDFWNKHQKRQGYGIGATQFKVEDTQSGTGLIQHLRKTLKGAVSGITRSKSESGFPAKFGRLMDQIIPLSKGKVLLPANAIDYAGTMVTDAAWVSDFVSENTEFSADDSHGYDDQVDVLVDMVAEFELSGSDGGAIGLYM